MAKDFLYSKTWAVLALLVHACAGRPSWDQQTIPTGEKYVVEHFASAIGTPLLAESYGGSIAEANLELAVGASGSDLLELKNASSGITAHFNRTSKNLRISGVASVSEYNKLLSSVTFYTINNGMEPTYRNISLQVTAADMSVSNKSSIRLRITPLPNWGTVTDPNLFAVNAPDSTDSDVFQLRGFQVSPNSPRRNVSTMVTLVGQSQANFSTGFFRMTCRLNGRKQVVDEASYCANSSFSLRAEDVIAPLSRYGTLAASALPCPMKWQGPIGQGLYTVTADGPEYARDVYGDIAPGYRRNQTHYNATAGSVAWDGTLRTHAVSGADPPGEFVCDFEAFGTRAAGNTSLFKFSVDLTTSPYRSSSGAMY